MVTSAVVGLLLVLLAGYLARDAAQNRHERRWGPLAFDAIALVVVLVFLVPLLWKGVNVAMEIVRLGQ